MQAMYENGVPNTMLIDRAAPALSNNTNGSVGKKRNAIDGEEAAVDKKYQALEGKVAESKLWDAEDAQKDRALKANQIIDTHQSQKSKNPDFNDENKKKPAPQRS